MEWNFGDILWTMLAFFFWFTFVWLFIAAISDVFRRRDLSGWAKAGWILLVVVLPLFGVIAYMVSRPPVVEDELVMMGGYGGRSGADPRKSSADEIATLVDLREKGAISADEYEHLKQRALV